MKNTSYFTLLSLTLLLGEALTSLSRAEEFQCTQATIVYDLQSSTRQLGTLQPPIKLEILEYVPSAQMYHVKFLAPDGKEIHGLCRPADINKDPSAGREILRADGVEAPALILPTPVDLKNLPGSFLSLLTSFETRTWEITPEAFSPIYSRDGFEAVSKQDLRTWRAGGGKKFLDLKLYEIIVKFQPARSQNISEITLLLFSRGDAKTDMNDREFADYIKSVETALDGWTGSKGHDAQVPNNTLNITRRSWFKAPFRADLESSVTRSAPEDPSKPNSRKIFRTEFVRLNLTPYDGKQDIEKLIKPQFQASAAPKVLKKDALKEHVTRKDDGDVYLNPFPMVDQGQKGYCAVASAERVLRYFGLDFDQNELAKLANTGTSGGTSTDGMAKAVKKIGSQYGIIIRELIDFDFQQFKKDVADYNQLARREKKEVVNLPNSGTIDINKIYSAMDRELLVKARLKNANGRSQFSQNIVTSINNGTPLLWSVQLGWIPEVPSLPQVSGGHMRLIIGYNRDKNEIIYTDSWGAGHEIKHMTIDNAFVITLGLHSVSS